MIATRQADYEVESTIQGEKIAMGIDQTALVHIMNIMTDLYSDPIMAVIREYSTNAHDAHVAAGQTRPIDVELPNDLSPYFRVRDYGIGMDREDIEKTYCLYGASSKRNTNDQQGMLGLGCKSALTYSSQFSIVAVKDHKRITVAVSRDETGAGSMTVLEEIDTTEGNSVEISVPVRIADNQKFHDRASRFYRFWEPGTVLVDGEQPEPIEGLEIVKGKKTVTTLYGEEQEEHRITVDRLLVIEGTEGTVQTSRVVMGNVAYPAPDLTTGLKPHFAVVAFMPIGSVEFTPAREALAETKATKVALRGIEQAIEEGLTDAVQRAVDAEKRPRDAFRVAAKWREMFSGEGDKYTFKYKGKEVPYTFSPPEGEKFRVVPYSSYKLSESGMQVRVYSGTAMDALWVWGYEAAQFSAVHKKKLLKYAEEKGITTRHFILTQNKLKSIWLMPEQVVPWEEVRKVQLPRKVNGRQWDPNRVPGSFDVHVGGVEKHGVPASEFDVSEPVYYINKTYDLDSTGEYAIVKALTEQEPNCTVVLLTNNRVAKFERDFPFAVHQRKAMTEMYAKAKRKVTKSALKAHKLQNQGDLCRYLAKLDADKLDDPILKAMIKQAGGHGVSAKMKKRIEEADRLSRLIGKGTILDTVEIINLNERYPLLDWRYRYWESAKVEHPHVYHYLNAAYAADAKESK